MNGGIIELSTTMKLTGDKKCLQHWRESYDAEITTMGKEEYARLEDEVAYWKDKYVKNYGYY